jgi:opacity protein-like surface antigen
MLGGYIMKKILLMTLSLLVVTSSAYAADRVKAKATTDLLNTFVTKSASTTPDRALYYQSDRDDVDNHAVTSGLTITINSTANTVLINRTDSNTFTSCTADYGSVSSINNTTNPKTLTIASDRLPLRVFCTTADGKTRGFFTTYKN